MKLVNFTEENLSKIHISQFVQFLKNHNINYKTKNYNDHFTVFINYYETIPHIISFDIFKLLQWYDQPQYFRSTRADFGKLCAYIHLDLRNNHLINTKIYEEQLQLHFIDTYNEIIKYKIKKEFIK